MKASEIRREARESLKGKWLKAACIYLIFYILTYIIGQLVGNNQGANFLGISFLVYYIAYIPLFFGLIISFMKIKRSEEVKVWDFIKDGFSRFKKSLGIQWHTFLKLLPHLILGIFICLIVSLILFFIASNTYLKKYPDPTGMSGFGISIIIVVFFALPTLIIWICPKYLLYVLAYNVSYDNPELSSKECVNKSKELMKGNRIKYFKLLLSFIGWFFLITIVYSIVNSIAFRLFNVQVVAGYVPPLGNQISDLLNYLIMIPGISLLIPYMQVATVCFYERVAKVETIDAEPAEKIEE